MAEIDYGVFQFVIKINTLFRDNADLLTPCHE